MAQRREGSDGLVVFFFYLKLADCMSLSFSSHDWTKLPEMQAHLQAWIGFLGGKSLHSSPWDTNDAQNR